MAVDQATHPDFFKYLLSINNNNNGSSINPIQIGNSNLTMNSLAVGGLTPAPTNDSYLLPFYGINDIGAFPSTAGKYQPAVKDDSGVTFNNSFVPPPAPSRKRQREPPAQMSSSLVAVNPIASTCGSTVNKQSSNSFSFLGEDLSLQIMQQQIEIDGLITQHIEKMKMEVEDRKKQQFRRVMAAIEESMAERMREKDIEIEKIGKINFELEEKVKTLCLENQLWRDLAQSNEATANALRTNLEQVLHQMRENAAAAETTDDAVSCCGSCGDGGEEREIDGCAQEEDGKKWVYRGEKRNRRLCRKCGEGESSVLLLPCRHLCLCTSCGPMVNTCPICNAVKNASVHVNLS